MSHSQMRPELPPLPVSANEEPSDLYQVSTYGCGEDLWNIRVGIHLASSECKQSWQGKQIALVILSSENSTAI